MSTALDEGTYNTSGRSNYYAQLDEVEARRQAQADQMMQLHVAQQQKAADQAARMEQQQQQQVTAQTMQGDLNQWTVDPYYAGRPASDVIKNNPEVMQHIRTAYGDQAASGFAPTWNKQQTENTGIVTGQPRQPDEPIPDGMKVKSAVVDDSGRVKRTYVPNGTNDIQFDEFTTPQQIEDSYSNGKGNSNELSMAKQIASHDLPQTALSRISQDAKLRIQAMIPIINPGWKASDFPIQQTARREFTTGKSAASVTSLNTAIDHLAQLNDIVDELHNRQGLPGAQTWNSMANAISKSTGNSAISRFNDQANVVSEEKAKALKGGVANVDDVKATRAGFDSSNGPDQLKDVISQSVRQFASRIQELREQYESAYGKPRDTPFIKPQTADALRKLGFDPSSIDPAIPKTAPEIPTPTAQQPVTPSQQLSAVTSQAQFDALPKGATYYYNGTLFRKP